MQGEFSIHKSINGINGQLMIILPKAFYRVNAISIKIPISFLIKIEKKYPKIHMKLRSILDSQNNPEHKKQCWKDYDFIS